MRRLIILALFLVASPALAQYWGHYANTRFGYEIDVPPDFVGQGESDNGDGQVFFRLKAEQGLTVWGGYLLDTFEAEVADRMTSASAENWGITDQTSTPDWASFSGQRDNRIFHTRLIALCDGAGYAAFRLEYNIRDLPKMEEVIGGLVRSFQPVGC